MNPHTLSYCFSTMHLDILAAIYCFIFTMHYFELPWNPSVWDVRTIARIPRSTRVHNSEGNKILLCKRMLFQQVFHNSLLWRASIVLLAKVYCWNICSYYIFAANRELFGSLFAANNVCQVSPFSAIYRVVLNTLVSYYRLVK